MNETLGKWVKAQRKASHLTQKALANKAGVGVRFIREMERGKPTLQLNKVNQVLLLFGYQMGPVPITRKEISNASS